MPVRFETNSGYSALGEEVRRYLYVRAYDLCVSIFVGGAHHCHLITTRGEGSKRRRDICMWHVKKVRKGGLCVLAFNTYRDRALGPRVIPTHYP